MCVYIYIVDLNDDSLLMILDQMEVEEIGKMFLVSTRFYELIREWSSILQKKKASGTPVHITIGDQPQHILKHFFMCFGDYMKHLVIDNFDMFAAVNTFGFCDNLQRLDFNSADMLAVGFIEAMMPNIQINLIPL